MIPPEVKPQPDGRMIGNTEVCLVRQVRRYELITPLFGGGVEPGEADPLTVIRGPEIRGQLRFWWRATRGGSSNGELKEMRRREEEIWGAACKPSRVEILALVEREGEKGRAREVALNYVAFPLRTQPRPLRTGVRFCLELVYPQELKDEVEAALWAWETFGGIGARTRRGFGALKLLKEVDGEPAPKCSEVEAWIRERLGKYVVEGRWPEGVPHLSRAFRMKIVVKDSNGKNFTGPEATWKSWKYLIDKLQEFRQARMPGRPPGRSFWPEPDTIRELTNRRSSGHQTPVSMVRKFPRAALGLPIVFHFKDPGDPYDTALEGEKLQRLASPLILRPLACADGAVGLALILEGTGIKEFLNVDKLYLRKMNDLGTKWLVDPLLTHNEASGIAPLRGNPDVLQAFLNRL